MNELILRFYKAVKFYKIYLLNISWPIVDLFIYVIRKKSTRFTEKLIHFIDKYKTLHILDF